jgi:predicted RNase H-like HicB family nuclease
MNEKHYTITLWHEDGCWFAKHPELEGCIADGETIEEAIASLNICRELWIESRQATGLPVPYPEFG